MRKSLLIVFVFCLVAAIALATIPTEKTRNVYSGNGTVFPYEFKIYAKTDLLVIVRDASGNEETQVVDSDYTVSGIGNDAGGNVTFAVAPASTETILILRNRPLKQETDYVEGGPFLYESHEDALDELTMLVQQLQEQLDRALLLQKTYSYTNWDLPNVVAGKILGWNESGDGVANYDNSGTVTVPNIDYIGNYSDSLTTAIASIGSTPTSLIIHKEIILTQADTVPSTLHLSFLQEGLFTLGAYNLTINSPISGPISQRFDDSGAGSVSFGYTATVYPEWWGDNTTPGTTDMTAEIQSACTAGSIIDITNSQIYKTTKTIIIGWFTSNGQAALPTFNLGGWTGLYWGGITPGTDYVVNKKIIGSGGFWKGGVGIGGGTEIKFEGTTEGPVFLVLNTSGFSMEHIIINGTDNSTADEGIFFAGHAQDYNINDVTYRNCKIGMRIGDKLNQTHDPIVYSDYWPDAVVTSNGWMQEFWEMHNPNFANNTIGLSTETSQMLHCNLYNPRFEGNEADGDIGLWANTGRITMFNLYMGALEIGVHIPVGGPIIRIYGGHGEGFNDDSMAINFVANTDLIVDGFDSAGGNIRVRGTAGSFASFRNCVFNGYVRVDGGPSQRFFVEAVNCNFMTYLKFHSEQNIVHARIRNCNFTSATETTPIQNLNSVLSLEIDGCYFGGASMTADFTAMDGRHVVACNPLTFTDSDATPTVAGGNNFVTNTTGVTITAFYNGLAGQEITIISKGAIVYDTSSASRLIGSTVDITTASGDVTIWICETKGTTLSVWRLKGFVDVSVDNSAGA